MVEKDFDEVAELIFHSTNGWYQERLGRSVFQGKAADCRIFCEVYEVLDPGCAIVVVENGEIVGSYFFHPRETHSSMGIMNVHPKFFGKGVAGMLMKSIVERSEARRLPLRLVSSALNLDSFSLYSRWGFSPEQIFQDLLIQVPDEGLGQGSRTVRPARESDVEAIGRLEESVAGIRRERDYRHFIRNVDGFWRIFVSLEESGEVDGFLVSSDHPASTMVGPGVSRTATAMESLLLAQFAQFRGRSVLFLLPCIERSLIDAAYQWGARNCELHFSQVRGKSRAPEGVVLPAFFPESG